MDNSTTPPAPTQPPPSLEIEYENALGVRWVADYVQVYADGWLVWQGTPEVNQGTLAIRVLSGAGKQEIYVRALASKRNDAGGAVASDRKEFVIRAGPQTLRIRLSGAAFTSKRFNVALQID